MKCFIFRNPYSSHTYFPGLTESLKNGDHPVQYLGACRFSRIAMIHAWLGEMKGLFQKECLLKVKEEQK